MSKSQDRICVKRRKEKRKVAPPMERDSTGKSCLLLRACSGESSVHWGLRSDCQGEVSCEFQKNLCKGE